MRGVLSIGPCVKTKAPRAWSSSFPCTSISRRCGPPKSTVRPCPGRTRHSSTPQRPQRDAPVLAFNFGHGSADRDRPVTKDVGVNAREIREFFDNSGPRELLQVSAGFAEFDAKAIDIPDSKSLSEEIVEAHSRNGELAARGSLIEAHVVHGFLFDQGQGFTRAGALRVKMPVAFETFASDSPNRVNSTQRAALDFANVDRDDGHSVTVLNERSLYSERV